MIAARLLVVAVALAAPSRLAYEDRAAELHVSAAEIQFAILHALLDWKGGANPPYSSYEARDRALLASVGLVVGKLDNPTRSAVLDEALGQVRQAHNYGVPDAYNGYRPITFEEVAARHRALLVPYADRIRLIRPDGSPPPPPVSDTPEEARRRWVWGLVGPLKEMARSPSDAEFSAALERFNAAAAKFGEGYRVSGARRRRDVYEAALAIYKRERNRARIDPK